MATKQFTQDDVAKVRKIPNLASYGADLNAAHQTR